MSREMQEFIYKDIKPSSIKVSDEKGLTYTQTKIYDFFARGDYYLGDNDVARFFYNGKTEPGYGPNTKWARKQMEVLVKKNLINKREDQSGIGPAHDRKFEYWHKNVDIKYLIDGSCYTQNGEMKSLKKYLGLPDGWFSKDKGNYRSPYKNFSTEIKVNDLIIKYKGHKFITHHGNFSWIHDIIGFLEAVDKPIRLPKYLSDRIESLRREYDSEDSPSYPYFEMGKVYDSSSSLYDEGYFIDYFYNGAEVYKQKDDKKAKEVERISATKKEKSDISDKYLDEIFKEGNRLLKEEDKRKSNTFDENTSILLSHMGEKGFEFIKKEDKYETEHFEHYGSKYKIEIFPDGWYQVTSRERIKYGKQGSKKSYDVIEVGRVPYKHEKVEDSLTKYAEKETTH